MNKNDFINAVLHKPWVNRAQSMEQMDCWGLVILYYQHVLSIELPVINGYSIGACSVPEGVSDQLIHWEKVDKPTLDGVVFMAFDGDLPAHVGVMISPTKMLHSRGSEETGGNVSIHSIQAMKSRYNRIEYYIFRGLND